MEVDYDVYAEGESLLGWLNCTAQLSASEPFDAGEVLSAISARIQQRLQSHKAEIAHLKMTLSPDQAIGGAIAAMSLVRNDFVPELSLELEDRVQSGQLIINLRAEAAPELLREIVTESLRALPGAEAKLEHIETFRPGRPTPTHRFTNALGVIADFSPCGTACSEATIAAFAHASKHDTHPLLPLHLRAGRAEGDERCGARKAVRVGRKFRSVCRSLRDVRAQRPSAEAPRRGRLHQDRRLLSARREMAF